MSNSDIMQRMSDACDQAEAGAITPAILGIQIVALAEALEGVPRQVVEEAREFELRLIEAEDHLEFGEEDQARAAAQAVVEDVRAWLAEICQA